jgi:hypothetical protein
MSVQSSLAAHRPLAERPALSQAQLLDVTNPNMMRIAAVTFNSSGQSRASFNQKPSFSSSSFAFCRQKATIALQKATEASNFSSHPHRLVTR